MELDLQEFSVAHHLSAKEAEIFRALMQGNIPLKDLSGKLGGSPSTIRNQLKSIFVKTGAQGKADLLCLYLKFILAKYESCRALVRKPCVMIVDDEPDLCEMMVEVLNRRGIMAYAYTDPSKVVDAVIDLMPDVVISDIRMPQMSGVDLLKQIRDSFRYPPAVLLISGFSEFHDSESVRASGAIGLLEKPIDVNQMFRLIMEHFTEDLHDRKRYLRVNSQLPVVADGRVKMTAANIGYGGVFLSFEGAEADGYFASVSPGDRIPLAISIGDDEAPIRTVAEVIWRRGVSSGGKEPGVGLRFVEMESDDRERVLDFVRATKLAGLIPIAQ